MALGAEEVALGDVVVAEVAVALEEDEEAEEEAGRYLETPGPYSSRHVAPQNTAYPRAMS